MKNQWMWIILHFRMIQCRSIFSLARVARQGKKVLHVYRQSRTLQSLSVHKHLYKAEFPPTTADSENCLCGVRDVWRIHSRSMAGHAHWRNVKHIKEAADSKYALKVTNFINRLRAAIKGISLWFVWFILFDKIWKFCLNFFLYDYRHD